MIKKRESNGQDVSIIAAVQAQIRNMILCYGQQSEWVRDVGIKQCPFAVRQSGFKGTMFALLIPCYKICFEDWMISAASEPYTSVTSHQKDGRRRPCALTDHQRRISHSRKITTPASDSHQLSTGIISNGFISGVTDLSLDKQ